MDPELIIKNITKVMSERAYNKFIYYYLHIKNGVVPKWLNLAKPQTFNEKIIWLKMYYKQNNASLLADKYKVRSYVKLKIGEKYLVPLIGVFKGATQIDFDSLPDSFVIKPNHMSGAVIIVRNKRTVDINRIKTILNKWIKTNYYEIGKSYEYKDIEPVIICEENLEDKNRNKPIIDYKIFCFHGEPYYIQVDLDRFTSHKRDFYDVKWHIQPFTTLYPRSNKRIEKPSNLDEMIWVAKMLAENTIFSRIDLYNIEGKIYFGEITLHHGGGFEPFYPKEYDYKLGSMIKLPLK